MGLFLHAAVILNCSNDEAETAVKNLSVKNRDFELVPKECRYEERNGGVNIIFNESANGYDQLAEELSLEAGHPVLLLYIYDGDFWGYYFYEAGDRIDYFNPVPEYYAEVSEEEKQRSAGDSAVISNYFQVREDDIRNYLVIWTEDMMDEDKKKAYDEDEFSQCDCWQMADFMKKIGFPYEW